MCVSYCGYITTLKDVRKHSNADRLQIAKVFGNSVVVGLDMKEGDKVLYFPTDGQLNYDFALKNNLLRKDKEGNPSKGYLDPDKRHIRSIKLRGEMSDGLIMSIDSLADYVDVKTLKEGDTITTLGGTLICEKYIPKTKQPSQMPQTQKNKVKEKESFPFFEQHIDTQQLAYNLGKFEEGDLCYITLKLHGTSQRTSYALQKKNKLNPLHRIGKLLFGTESMNKWKLVTGTRRVNLKDFNGGYYGGNQFRKKWHDFFEGKLHKGETVYLELVGYADEDRLIMPASNNKLLNDKEFVKKYGDTTEFTYGCENGESDIYVYRMTKTDEDGQVVEYPWELVKTRCEQMGVKHVPELDKFLFTTKEDLMERVNKHEVGSDLIDPTHIREGVIVRIEGKEKFTALKQKNFEFKVLEGIIKDSGALDMEEAESL